MTEDRLLATQQLFRDGQHAAAARLCQQLLDANPRNARACHLLGLIHLQQGEAARGLVLLTRAADADPNYGPAHVDLGRVLLQHNQPQAAYPHLEAAVRMHPDVAELRRNLGNALHGLGRLAEARDAYLAALAIEPALASAQANLAMVHLQEGALDESLVWLQRAVEAQPDNPMFWEQLAMLHQRRGEFSAADRAWQRILGLRPAHPRAHLAVGAALERKGRLDEAAEHYRAALQLQAGLSEAHAALARLHEQRGELTQAEQAIRRGLAIEPGAANLHVALARVLRGKLPDGDFAALDARIAESRVNDPSRARLLFARALALDARGDYHRAAESANRANALTLDVERRAGRAHDGAAFEQFVSGLLAAFDERFFTRTQGGGNGSRRPVFVFGLPRSGTTLVAQILGAHPSVHAAGELTTAFDTFQSMPLVLNRPLQPLGCVAELDAAALGRLAERHLAELHAIDASRAERVVDKGPANYQFLGLLAALFPNAVFIHCRRELRDVAVSCWLTKFEHVRWSHDARQMGAYFRQYLRIMDHWQQVLPHTVHHVDYEETVSDQEGVARRLLDACGLPWDPACLDFQRASVQVRTSSSAQVRQPIYTHSVGRWKHYEELLGELFDALPERRP